MWAIVGLGNPGLKYNLTRHNIGFTFIKLLAKTWETRARKRSHLSKVVTVERDSKKVLLAMPQTFMNRSGDAVQQILNNLPIAPEQIIIIYDDFELPLGEIRIRRDGGAGSHKGMSSIISVTGTNRFPRVRIGIGPLPEEQDAADFVLSPFAKQEKPMLTASLEKTYAAVELVLLGETEKAMNLYN